MPCPAVPSPAQPGSGLEPGRARPGTGGGARTVLDVRQSEFVVQFTIAGISLLKVRALPADLSLLPQQPSPAPAGAGPGWEVGGELVPFQMSDQLSL